MLLKASKKPAKRLVEWLSKNHFFSRSLQKSKVTQRPQTRAPRPFGVYGKCGSVIPIAVPAVL